MKNFVSLLIVAALGFIVADFIMSSSFVGEGSLFSGRTFVEKLPTVFIISGIFTFIYHVLGSRIRDPFVLFFFNAFIIYFLSLTVPQFIMSSIWVSLGVAMIISIVDAILSAPDSE